MGGCLSCAFAAEDEYVPKGNLGARELDEMDVLTQGSLRRAYGLFKRADTDRNGKLDASELARMFNLEDDVYLRRMVEIIDCDGNGTIDFREFVVGLAAFVLSGSFGRVRFAFRLFDLNNDGSFSKRELLTAIRAAESRHEASRDARAKRSANYWGDRATPDPLERYKDLIQDLDARPDELGYEEFTRIVTRHPRIFAPVNQMWHALRQYADPAVKVVTHIRQSGNARFFRGTVLEPGRAEHIFAPPGTAPGDADGATRARRRRSNENTNARRIKKSAADRAGDERGLKSDSSRFRRWLDDAASSVVRTAAVGLERVSSFGSPSGRPRTARHATPAWEADARLARSPSEKSAEQSLDEDFAELRGFEREERLRGDGRRGGSEHEDAASDVTMREIWEALRGAPDPNLPNPRSLFGDGDVTFAATEKPNAESGSVRLRLAAAAAAAPPPADYSSTLDIAALAQRRVAAQKARDAAMRLKQRSGRGASAPTPSAERDARSFDAGGKHTLGDAPKTKTKTKTSAPRREGEGSNVAAVIAAHRAARRKAPRRRRDGGDEASLAGGFLARVQRHAAAGPPSEEARLGL
jgi:Ca2+-binding EF-hand superfamily protein